jgi:hypothetical protein
MVRIAHLPEVYTEAEDESTNAATSGKTVYLLFPTWYWELLPCFSM